jgi:hypothetical protein
MRLHYRKKNLILGTGIRHYRKWGRHSGGAEPRERLHLLCTTQRNPALLVQVIRHYRNRGTAETGRSLGSVFAGTVLKFTIAADKVS